jgi:hypothetical protein
VRRFVLLVLLLLALPVPAATAQSPVPDPRVLVVAVPGLRWGDITADTTPALHELSRTGALGVLSGKGAGARTCLADAWLTLAAGARAEAFGVPCGELPRNAERDALRRRNLATREQADPDALVRALELNGGCLAGGGPGAGLAGARGDAPSVTSPSPGPELDCPVLLLESPRPLSADDAARARALTEADDLVAAAARARDRDDALLVVGLPLQDAEQLHVALADGPSFPPGALVSATTRRPPYVQLVDVLPTLIDVLGLRPVEEPVQKVIGEPWRSVGEPPTVAELVDLDRQAVAHRQVTVPFFVVLVAVQLVLVPLLLWRRRLRAAELVALTGTAATGASYLANLVPWWRSEVPLLALLAVVTLLAAATGALIFELCTATRRTEGARVDDQRKVGARREVGAAAGPAALVCAAVAAVLLVDLVTGARLQISSVAGYSPLVAGRFAGIGNVAFGVLAASSLLATAVLARRAWQVVVVGLVVVVVDGAPWWGSDVGGVLALVPGFALLALLVAGRRLTLTRLVAAGLAGLAVVIAFALGDWRRAPQDRTHLGRFVEDLMDGSAGAVLERKAEAVFGLLFANPVTALLPLVVAALVLLVARPPAPLAHAFAQTPRWRYGLLALGLTSAVGFAVNDSGAAVPALAVVVALPATVAVVVRARRRPSENPSLLA